jgi:hypothetical protein
VKRINYKDFIEENFLIINKEGKTVPFIFNDTQNYYWGLLLNDYPTLQNVRENILKFRQPGFSSLIDAMFTVDFIFSEEGKQPITFSDIYSHKDDETLVLFRRVSFYLNSYYEKNHIDRSKVLLVDKDKAIEGVNHSMIASFTANAKVSGRGGTKQNIHLSEPAFYPNTEVLDANSLVLGLEQQVADGVGKIFRESTGNIIGDFFNEEYEFGKLPGAKFKSRFLGWWLHNEYRKEPPADWTPPEKYQKLIEQFGATIQSCYWHYNKIMSAKPADRERLSREYPCDDIEAFLQQGKLYFNVEALKYYKDEMSRSPISQDLIYV